MRLCVLLRLRMIGKLTWSIWSLREEHATGKRYNSFLANDYFLSSHKNENSRLLRDTFYQNRCAVGEVFGGFQLVFQWYFKARVLDWFTGNVIISSSSMVLTRVYNYIKTPRWVVARFFDEAFFKLGGASSIGKRTRCNGTKKRPRPG